MGCPNVQELQYPRSTEKVVTASSATSLTILGEGDVILNIWNGIMWRSTVLKKCLHVKGLSKNLFLVPSAVAQGANINMTQTGVEIVVNGQIVGVGVKSGSLYHLKNREYTAAFTSDYLTHRRMEHSSSHPAENCEVRHSAKQIRKSFPKKKNFEEDHRTRMFGCNWAI
jgi:hypothetical protein